LAAPRASLDLFAARGAFPSRLRFSRGSADVSHARGREMVKQSREYCRIFGVAVWIFFGGKQLLKPFIQPAGEDFSANEFGIAENSQEKRCVRFDPGDAVFHESTLQSRNGLGTILSPGDQFSQHWIIFRWDGEALVNAVIEPNSGARRSVERKNSSRRREEIVGRVFGIEAALDGVASERNILLRERKRLVGNRAALGAWVGLGSGSAGGALGALPVFFYFLNIGAVLFGSGYVLLPVLRADLVVKLRWLSDSQLLDAVAVSQATPGPFFTVATFIGYLLASWKGATLATLGMFLPAFGYVGITSGFLPEIRKSPLAGAFLDGVNAAAVALMAFVGWQFGRAALTNVPAAILATLGAVLVFRYKVNSTWLVLGGAAAGILLRWMGWS